MYHSFEDLEVWKKACNLAVKTYEVLRECRDYGLKDQMTRAAVSIPSNIAEGAERDSAREFTRFLNIARASAAELRTQVNIASRIGVLDEKTSQEMTDELTSTSKMLRGLSNKIKSANSL